MMHSISRLLIHPTDNDNLQQANRSDHHWQVPPVNVRSFKEQLQQETKQVFQGLARNDLSVGVFRLSHVAREMISIAQGWSPEDRRRAKAPARLGSTERKVKGWS